MATFSVLVLTAAPPGLAAEMGGQGGAGGAGGAFVKIDGREALLRSVELFLNRDSVKQIHLAIAPEAMDDAKARFGAHLGFSGVKLISAGPRWMDQIAASVATLNADVSHVLVHDAARPAVAFSDIDALMAAAEKHQAVALVAPVKSSLVEVDEGGSPVAFHTPSSYRQILTPQAFARATFLEMANKKTELHPSRMWLLNGSSLNVRVGGSGDAGLVKAMINMLPKPKIKAGLSPFDEAQW
jgi:2-C-methyl-D-erythritol 4-phosphate cytidylyltransferase